MVAMTDDERSNTTTPLNPNAQDSGLGATDPPKGAAPDALRVASPPSPAIVPPEEEAIKAPSDPDMLVPYWEKPVLPARPGTSSRRQPVEEGKEKKLVVYKTQKTKKMEAEARKKRGEEGGPSPEKAKKSERPKSALPPLKQRRRVHGAGPAPFGGGAISEEVMVPDGKVDKGAKWTGSSGGEAWTVDVPISAKASNEPAEPSKPEVFVLSP